MKTEGFIPPKIEHGIEMPPRSHALYKWKGVLLAMKPGDSISVPEYRDKQAVLKCADHHKLAVASRKINGGFRIWRVVEAKKGQTKLDQEPPTKGNR